MNIFLSVKVAVQTSCSHCLEICETQLPETIRACRGLYKNLFTFLTFMPGEERVLLLVFHKNPVADLIWIYFRKSLHSAIWTPLVFGIEMFPSSVQ